MADLKIKIDEEQYRDALNRLRAAGDGLSGELQKLKDQRVKLNDNFFSRVLSASLIDMIETKEQQVQGSIDNLNKQITQIENLLTSMSAAESNIKNKIDTAAASNVAAFM